MSFRRTGDMHRPRSAHAAAPLGGGRVLVTGGSSAGDLVLSATEVYDSRTGRFTPAAAMTTNRHKHAVVPLGRGSALVVGGSDSRDFNGRLRERRAVRRRHQAIPACWSHG